MDAAQATSVAATDQIAVLQAAGFAFATVDMINAAPAAQLAALQLAITALAARVAALESRPEEVAHFAASAKLPAVAALGSVTLVLSALVPARAGDILKAGESVSVQPATTLPDGLNYSLPTVTADGIVTVKLTASLAIAAGAAAIVWNISALR